MFKYPLCKKATNDILMIVFLATVCAIGLNIVFVHVAADVLPELAVWQYVHAANLAPSPLQFRWLSYFLPEIIISSGVDVVTTHLLFRTVYLGIALFFIGLIARRLIDNDMAPIVMICAISFYYAVSTQAHFQFSEEPNIMVYSIFIWLVISNANFLFILSCFVFGALTKDTVGFLIPFYLIYRLRFNGFKYSILTTSILSSVFLAIYIGLRWYFGADREYLGGLWQYSENLRYIFDRPDKGMMWTLASILPLFFIAINWDRVPFVVKSFVPSAVLFIVGHLLISRVEEFRTYTPLAILLWSGVLAIKYNVYINSADTATPKSEYRAE